MAAPQPLSTDNNAEPVVRPKVLRRPAQFAASKPALITPAPVLLTSEPEAAPTTPASKTWQDDGRFAITLLAIVILLNLMITLWLATIEQGPAEEASVESITVETTDTPGISADGFYVLNGLAAETTEE